MDERVMPLATIAVPTYNRAELLKRAIASAQAQDYSSIEILVVDNASEDQTMDVCRTLADGDPRIRYMRQSRNVGPLRNFETGLENARGRYFMWLADDDWISPDYVRRCAEELEKGDHAIVVGQDYTCAEDEAIAAPVVTALEPEPVARMLNYLKVVGSNSATYGLSRTEDLRGRLPFPSGVAGDWLWVLAVLSKGTLGVVTDVHLYRDRWGVSSDFQKMAAQLGHGRFASRFPRMAGAINVFKTMARGHWCDDLEVELTRFRLASKASVIVAIKLNPLDDIVDMFRRVLKRLMPKRGYHFLRNSFQPVRRVEGRIRSRLLSTTGQSVRS